MGRRQLRVELERVGSIRQLYQDDLLSLEDAMKLADNPEELKMELRGIVKGARATDFDFNF